MTGRPTTLAEQVAGELRDRIVDGTLRDGDLLPKQDALGAEFAVSKPTLREAIRILESEGLIEVQQGRQGGSIVRTPRAEHLAVTMALVLEADGVHLPDVGAALREIEPSCVRLCASRADRAEAVVPRLRALQADARAAVADDLEVIALSRRFHEALAEACGNASLALCAGALERVWSAHEQVWADTASDSPSFPGLPVRHAALDEHEAIIDAIEAGDADGAAAAARHHLATSQLYALHRSDDPLAGAPLRRRAVAPDRRTA